MTDFRTVQTRVRQQMLPSALLRDGGVKARGAKNPLSKVILTAGVWVSRRAGARECDFFYSEANRWEATGAEGHWQLVLRDPSRPGYRHPSDPTMILETLRAVVDETHGEDIGGAPTTRVRVRVDLTLIEDRLGKALHPRVAERRSRRWVRNAPMIAWLDASGLLTRISYAPLPPNTTEPFWTTLDLFDFGTPLETPELAGGTPGRR